MQQYYVTAEVSRLTGYSIDQLNRAHRAGLPEPARAGCHRIYTAEDIERVRAYFAQRDRGADAPGRRAAAS